MNIKDLEKLSTEGRNPNTLNIDSVSTLKMVEMINAEDKKVAFAVEEVKEQIAMAIDVIAERISRGGRLIYIGAGTSGRLGILDASECPPTYGVDFNLVKGLIAGGNTAIFKAVEGAEDNALLGVSDVKAIGLTENDTLCGIAASGRTPYVIGAMNYAKEIGAAVIAVTMSENSEMASIAQIPISVVVGPEAIMGSTRMKSGTAQKMVLNMLSTGAMIKLGKVYSNLMVDVQPSNEKLIVRAKRIVKLATDAEEEVIENILKQTDNNVKLAIIMIETGLPKDKAKDKAKELLLNNKGFISEALKVNEC